MCSLDAAPDGWFDTLTPRREGSTENAFFMVNEKTHRIPTVERRNLTVPMPRELQEVYARYPSDTEFSTTYEWTFLSEDQIKSRWEAMVKENQRRMVDLAIMYRGMGHVMGLSYDPDTDGVFTGLDGGADGHARMHNYMKRVGQDVDALPTVSLQNVVERSGETTY